MAPFAAGLLIYWITSNILTLAQQTEALLHLQQFGELFVARSEAQARERVRSANTPGHASS